MVDGEGQAEQVDQDPENVQHIVAVWTLGWSGVDGEAWSGFEWSGVEWRGMEWTWTMGQEGSCTCPSLLAASAPLRKVGPRLMVMLANLAGRRNT